MNHITGDCRWQAQNQASANAHRGKIEVICMRCCKPEVEHIDNDVHRRFDADCNLMIDEEDLRIPGRQNADNA